MFFGVAVGITEAVQGDRVQWGLEPELDVDGLRRVQLNDRIHFRKGDIAWRAKRTYGLDLGDCCSRPLVGAKGARRVRYLVRTIRIKALARRRGVVDGARFCNVLLSN